MAQHRMVFLIQMQISRTQILILGMVQIHLLQLHKVQQLQVFLPLETAFIQLLSIAELVNQPLIQPQQFMQSQHQQ